MKSEIKNQRFVLSAVNLTYKDFFDKILTAFGKPKTKRQAGKFALALGWRGEKILTALNGENPRVTKETAMTALQVNRYDGSLITKTIGFNYRDCDKTIEETIAFYK
jgi:hypothetical protein